MKKLGNLSKVPIVGSTEMTPQIITFLSNITMSCISSTILDRNSQHALTNVTAWSMNVAENTITYKNRISRLSSQRNLRSAITLFTTSYTIIAITQATVPLNSTSYTNPMLLYNNMTYSITEAINTGSFTNRLQEMSILFNATQTEKANVTHVSNSPLLVKNVIYVTPTSVENVGAFTVMIITIMMFIVICGLYTYCRSTISIKIHQVQEKENYSRMSAIVV